MRVPARHVRKRLEAYFAAASTVRLTDLPCAALTGGTWTQGQLPLPVHCVPSSFDGTYVGFAFIDPGRGAFIGWTLLGNGIILRS